MGLSFNGRTLRWQRSNAGSTPASSTNFGVTVVMLSHQTWNADCLDIIPNIESSSVDLALLDPPYFKVVSESWDYEWRTLQDYNNWVARWAVEVARTVRLGGSVYLFGYYRNLMKVSALFEALGFELRQQIVINKGLRALGGRHTKQYKMFPVVTESVLFMVKDSRPFIRDLLLRKQAERGLTSKQINEALGVKSNGGGMWSLYSGDNILAQVPTRELWDKLTSTLGVDVPYEKFSVTFNLIRGLTDVWSDIDFYSEERVHPTQKPLPLIRRILEASSNPGDTVLDPFLGSGTTLVACHEMGRRCIGVEKDSTSYAAALKRFDAAEKKRLEREQDKRNFELMLDLANEG